MGSLSFMIKFTKKIIFGNKQYFIGYVPIIIGLDPILFCKGQTV